MPPYICKKGQWTLNPDLAIVGFVKSLPKKIKKLGLFKVFSYNKEFWVIFYLKYLPYYPQIDTFYHLLGTFVGWYICHLTFLVKLCEIMAKGSEKVGFIQGI